MLHDDGQFYGSLWYPKTVSTLSHNLQKLSIRYQGRYFETRISLSKTVSLGFQDKRASFKDWTFVLFFVKESRYLLLKRQNDMKIGLISASFPLSASPFSLSNSCLTDQTTQRE